MPQRWRPALLLRVGHENDAIHPAQDQLAAGVVEYLSRNGIEVNAGLETTDRAQIQGQKVEEQGTFRLRRQRDHLALLLFGCLLKNILKIGGLAAQPGAVINNLAIDLAGCKVDETQGFPQYPNAGVRIISKRHCLEILLGAAGFISQAPALLAGYSGY